MRPVFDILKYIQAEQEVHWALHLATFDEMIPLFASGHTNYARYGSHDLQSMQSKSDEVCKHFIKEQHTMHHTAGIFNGIRSDMAIETTFMRYGHCKGGIIGITLQAESVKTWAYSLCLCNSLTVDLDEM